MNWEPARADHSIDRATASIVLSVPIVDANTFDELVVAGRKAAAEQHLTDRVDMAEAIELPQPPPGAVVDLSQFSGMAPRRVLFRRLDAERVAVDELAIGAQRIAVGTLRYRRWSDLFRLLSKSLAALETIYPISQNTKSVRLEYVDRFESAPGGADHFEVLRRESDFLCRVIADKTAALHVHSGWFDFETPHVRKLTNVNIDVHDITIPAPPDARRKITVLSMGQFEALQGTLDNPVSRLDDLHAYLKSIFGRIITPGAAARVALND
jgi:uncharacterized protein (TIGR04255 family)